MYAAQESGMLFGEASSACSGLRQWAGICLQISQSVHLSGHPEYVSRRKFCFTNILLIQYDLGRGEAALTCLRAGERVSASSRQEFSLSIHDLTLA